jgi:hypothetical protein
MLAMNWDQESFMGPIVSELAHEFGRIFGIFGEGTGQ